MIYIYAGYNEKGFLGNVYIQRDFIYMVWNVREAGYGVNHR